MLRSVSVPYITSCNTYWRQVVSDFQLLFMSSEHFRRCNNLEFGLTAVLLNIRIRTSDGPLWTCTEPSGYQKYKRNFEYLNCVSFWSWHVHQVWVYVHFKYGRRWIVNNPSLLRRILRNSIHINFVHINWF